MVGTPGYMAPEIIKGNGYDQNVDWWTIGCLLYELLIGKLPFRAANEFELQRKIKSEQL